MVRAGIMIYGFYPSKEVDREKLDLKPAMTLKARISNIKRFPPKVLELVMGKFLLRKKNL